MQADDQVEQDFLSDNGSDDLFELDDVYGNQNHLNFDEPIMEGIRRNVPLQAVYAIMNTMLVAMGKTEKYEFLSYDKVRSIWKRLGGELEAEHDEIGGYEHLGLDGKKSNVIGQYNQMEKSVDKLTFICQSSYAYVDHKIPESGHGVSVAKVLYEVVENTNSLESIKSISTDSPNQMTGWKDGAVRKFEEMIQNEVQHLHCDLHLNEKVLEKVFIHIGKLYFLLLSHPQVKVLTPPGLRKMAIIQQPFKLEKNQGHR